MIVSETWMNDQDMCIQCDNYRLIPFNLTIYMDGYSYYQKRYDALFMMPHKQIVDIKYELEGYIFETDNDGSRRIKVVSIALSTNIEELKVFADLHNLKIKND